MEVVGLDMVGRGPEAVHAGRAARSARRQPARVVRGVVVQRHDVKGRLVEPTELLLDRVATLAVTVRCDEGVGV